MNMIFVRLVIACAPGAAGSMTHFSGGSARVGNRQGARKTEIRAPVHFRLPGELLQLRLEECAAFPLRNADAARAQKLTGREAGLIRTSAELVEPGGKAQAVLMGVRLGEAFLVANQCGPEPG